MAVWDSARASLTYLRISVYSFPFLTVYNGCAGLFRSTGRTKTLIVVSIMMNIINVTGNAFGVFALHAEVAGVAYPSLISRAFAAVVMLWLSTNQNNPICIRMKQIFTWQAGMIRRIFRIAVPNSIENGLFQISKVAPSSIVTMFASIFSTVVCRVALSVFFGIVLDLGVIGITLAIVADWGIHAVLVIRRYYSGKWKTFEVI